MIESNKTYYECEYCGKVSQDYDEIKECEKTCKSISAELEKIIESCNKLNELGCTIGLRDFPYYEENKLDAAAIRRISKQYKFAFSSNDYIGLGGTNILPCSVRQRRNTNET